MKKIIGSFLIILLTILLLPMVLRKQNDTRNVYVPITRYVEYMGDYTDDGLIISTFVTNITTLKDTVADGYHFGDFTKSVYYVLSSAVMVILIPFDFIVYNIEYFVEYITIAT